MQCGLRVSHNRRHHDREQHHEISNVFHDHPPSLIFDWPGVFSVPGRSMVQLSLRAAGTSMDGESHEDGTSLLLQVVATMLVLGCPPTLLHIRTGWQCYSCLQS